MKVFFKKCGFDLFLFVGFFVLSLSYAVFYDFVDPGVEVSFPLLSLGAACWQFCIFLCSVLEFFVVRRKSTNPEA